MSTWMLVLITVVSVFIGSIIAMGLLTLLGGWPWWADLTDDGNEETHL